MNNTIELPPRSGGSAVIIQEDAPTVHQPPGIEDNFVSMLERAARDTAIDIEKMARLLDMRETILARERKRKFDVALSEAQNEMRRVAADSTNPQTRSKYASYAALDKAIRPIYPKYGLSVTFNTADCPMESWVRVVCDVSHVDGYSRAYHLDIPADGKGAKGGDVMTKTHAVGSALSYGRRYLLILIFNIAIGIDNDDGNGASEKPPTISQDEATLITKELFKTHTELNKFLEFFRIKALLELPHSRLEEAFTILQRKAVKEAAKK